MIHWHPLSLQDKEKINQAPLFLSDYSFTNLWMWNSVRSYKIATIDGFLCIRYNDTFLYPLGVGPRTKIVQTLIEHYSPLTMRAIPEHADLDLSLIEDRDHFDYIYLYDDLLHLPGNNYQSKRNLIHQFTSHYPFEYRSIDAALIPQIEVMEKTWFKNHKTIKQEHQAILHLLKSFHLLDAIGGALLVNGQVIAYTIAEYLSPDCLVIHIEKALTSYKGAYQMIQNQFLQHIKPVTYINREEDLGLPNLIKMKQSYHPIRFEKKYRFTN